ncbi:DUF6580 family putative transport protein [Parafilimonas sp.]|uniref:DUF6580 family putative transport protein n=1 Tax=Parafilimonas sp. TaxID=1969739 RepID=UPI0039E2A0D9
MKLSKQTIFFFLVLVAVSTFVKFICAPQINLSGFTAVIAVSLFSGLAIQDKKLAFLLPLVTLFLSDVLLQGLYAANIFPFAGFYSGQITNYILFTGLTLTGIAFKKYRAAGVVSAAITGPTVFFLLSNFIVWKTQAGILGYNKDVSGLWQSYGFGLPFYRNSLISTFIFLPLFIAVYNRIRYGKLSLAQ